MGGEEGMREPIFYLRLNVIIDSFDQLNKKRLAKKFDLDT